MTRALLYEWARIRSVRLTWWIAGLSMVITTVAATGYSALVSTMVSAEAKVDGLEAIVMILSKPSAAPIAAGVLGVFAVGNDFRFGTMSATLLITPRRTVALGARAVVVAGFGSALALAGLAAAWVVGTLMVGRQFLGRATALELFSLCAAQIALTVGWALLGTFIAILLRSQVAALTTMLAVPFAVEPALRTMALLSGRGWLEQLAGLLPFAAGNAMTDISHGATGTLLASTSVRLGPLAGGLVFFGMTAVVGTGALLHFRRQDVP
jgi:ABC-2 type transport system permease protein